MSHSCTRGRMARVFTRLNRHVPNRLLKNPLTTGEIKACVDDLKVLGKKDFKMLLKYRTEIREDVRTMSTLTPMTLTPRVLTMYISCSLVLTAASPKQLKQPTRTLRSSRSTRRNSSRTSSSVSPATRLSRSAASVVVPTRKRRARSSACSSTW